MLNVTHRFFGKIAGIAFITLFAAIFALSAQPIRAQDPYTRQLIPLDFSTSALTPEQIANLMTGFTSTPTGSNPVGAFILSGFATYSLDTQEAFGVSCDQIVVYKVSPTRTQERWDDVVCRGNTLFINSAGTGHYLFYLLGDVPDALLAPAQLITISVGDL